MSRDTGWCSDQHGSKAISHERPMSLEQPSCLQGQGLMALVKSPTRKLQAFPHGSRERMPLCAAVTLVAMYQGESGPYESGAVRQ